jgi:hypothetical protein
MTIWGGRSIPESSRKSGCGQGFAQDVLESHRVEGYQHALGRYANTIRKMAIEGCAKSWGAKHIASWSIAEIVIMEA